MITAARQSAQSTVKFFRSLQSFRIDGLDEDQKTDVVVNSNSDVQINLQKLSKLADAFAPKTRLNNASGDLGDLVDREMTNAARAIEAATERLSKLMNKSRDGYSTYELKIHEYVPSLHPPSPPIIYTNQVDSSILEAAIAVTSAIARLIKAATASQSEIVAQGRGSGMSRTAFYKKNNRWTEGLISAAKAIEAATERLSKMMNKSRDGYSTYELKIHEYVLPFTSPTSHLY